VSDSREEVKEEENVNKEDQEDDFDENHFETQNKTILSQSLLEKESHLAYDPEQQEELN
jgi:hypothetical protein